MTESGGHRVDVARQGEIEQNQRTARSIGHRRRDVVGRKHGAGRGGGTDDDVEIGQPGRALCERECGRAQASGERRGAAAMTPCDREGCGAVVEKGPGRLLADFAGAQQQNLGGGEIAHDGLRQTHGDLGETHATGGDRRVRARVFGRLKTFLENAIEHGSGAPADVGVGVGGFHLPQNLGLSDELGIKPGRHFEQVLERVAAGEGHAKRPEFGRGKVTVGAPRGFHVGDRRRILGDAVELNPVAGAQNDQFVETRVGGERGVKRGGAFGAQSQSLAHGEGSAPMGGTEQKETGTVYARSRHGREAAGNIARAR